MGETLKRLIGATPLTIGVETSSALSVVPVLDVLTTDIRKAHAEIESALSTAAVTAVERGIEIGKWLREAKKLAGHGNYEDWLARNFTFTPKTAQNYMRLARQEAKLRQTLEEKRTAGSVLSMKDALALISLIEGKRKTARY